MSTNDEVRDELPNTTEDAPAVQSSIGQPSTVNSDDDDFVDPPPPVPRQVQRTSKGGDKGKQDVKTTKRKAATVAAKKICQSPKNVPKGKMLTWIHLRTDLPDQGRFEEKSLCHGFCEAF